MFMQILMSSENFLTWKGSWGLTMMLYDACTYFHVPIKGYAHCPWSNVQHNLVMSS